MIWLLGQLQGLADALAKVHNPPPEFEFDWYQDVKPENILSVWELNNDNRVGHHHDVKPANVLLFSQLEHSSGSGLKAHEEGYPRLQLTDLGLGKVSNDQSETEDTRTTRTYAAPEALMFHKPKFGREADVWSCACLIIEAIL